MKPAKLEFPNHGPAENILRLRQVVLQLEAVKPLYAEQDALIAMLLEQGFKGATLSDGSTATLVDNFVDPKTGLARNTVFRPAGVKRFEIKFEGSHE